MSTEARESDDGRRLRKRRTAIEAIKTSQDYIELLILLSIGKVDENARPVTPDCTDLRITKRAWESSVQEWRRKIRACVQVSQPLPATARAVSAGPAPWFGYTLAAAMAYHWVCIPRHVFVFDGCAPLGSEVGYCLPVRLKGQRRGGDLRDSGLTYFFRCHDVCDGPWPASYHVTASYALQFFEAHPEFEVGTASYGYIVNFDDV